VVLEPRADNPKDGRLKFTNLATHSVVYTDLLPVGGDVYQGKLAKALEDVELVVEIGDARTQSRVVRAVPRPEIDSTHSDKGVHYHLPKYTEEEAPAPQKFGALSALQGSTADLQFTATKPLKSAVVERSDGRKYPMKAVASSRPDEKANTTWSVPEIPIDKSGQFHVILVDELGLTNSTPMMEYPIDARPDLAPAIKLVRPTRDTTVTPTARQTIVFNAHDDYGLRMVWVAYYIQSEGNDSAPRSDGRETAQVKDIKKIEIPIKRDEKTNRLYRDLDNAQYVLDLAALKVKVGDMIVFWLECDDFCDTNDDAPARKTADGTLEAQPGAKVYPRTQEIKLTVISRADKEEELRADLKRLYQAVERHEKTEQEIKQQTLDIQEQLQKPKP
jgi:hypothetical protein